MAMRKPHYIRFAEGDDDKSGGGSGKPPADMPNGYPKDTPLVEMTSEQREAYWKYHARQHEGVAKSRADYDDQKALADKWREYENSNKAPDQKVLDDAVTKAREEARKEEQAKLAPRLVKAEFKALGTAVPKELLDAFLEDVNHTVYLKDDGEVDVDKVQRRVDALAPKQQQTQRKQTHQGYRPSDGATSVTAGRDLFASRNKDKKG